jgi:hypothetical protein
MLNLFQLPPWERNSDGGMDPENKFRVRSEPFNCNAGKCHIGEKDVSSLVQSGS